MASVQLNTIKNHVALEDNDNDDVDRSDNRDTESILGSRPTIGTSTSKLKKALLGLAIVIVTFSVFVLFVGIASAGNNKKEDSTGNSTFNWRLPNHTHPIHYSLKVETDFSKFSYHVDEYVQIKITSKVSSILMHSVDHNITYVRLYKNAIDTFDDSGVEPSSIKHIPEYDFVLFTFDSLKKWTSDGDEKQFTLVLKFDGLLDANMRGFYKSSYRENGQVEWLAATDFEPINSRNAFVAFDEPAMKATFSITLVIDKEYTALSNMPVKSTTSVADNKKEVAFETTVRMSTYLVCYIVSKFKAVSGMEGNINVSVWTTPDTISQAEFALTVAKGVLAHYQEYYKIPFPLPKLDLIAIPDYSSGAMENWGLITFRQTALLYDPNESNTSNKQRVAVVIAHELAHQWFGNYVTMEFWNDLWLNEGFASFMEYRGTDAVFPDWQMWDQFTVSDRKSAFELDVLKSSHPLSVPIEVPTEIEQQFDGISYSKGACVIKQVESYLNKNGKHVFPNGLTQYLNEHNYSNAQSSDLWKALSAASNDENIAKMMDTWTLQTGYPLLTLTYDSVNKQITASQKRFTFLPHNGTELWWIPCTCKTLGNNQEHDLSLPLVESKVFPYDYQKDGVIIANLNATGYFRVKYEGSLFEYIKGVLYNNPTAIYPANRASIIDDTFSLVTAGIYEVDKALDIIGYLEHQGETDFAVWINILQQIGEFDRLLSTQPVYGIFQKFVLSLVNSALTKGSLDDNLHTTKLLKPQLLSLAAKYGDSTSVNLLLRQFRQLMAGNSTVDPDDRAAVYTVGIAHGGEEEYNFLLDRSEKVNVAAEKLRCLNALAQSRQLYLLQKTLEISLDESIVRKQDTVSVIAAVARNDYGRELAWNFFRENYDVLLQRYTGSAFALADLISSVTQYFSTEVKLQEVNDFLSEHPTQSGSRTIDQTLEQIRANINWVNTHGVKVTNWLNDWAKTTRRTIA